MAHRMASANANRMANRMAKPMRSRWQKYAPNPNPNPNTHSSRLAFACGAINSKSNLTLGNARLLGIGAKRMNDDITDQATLLSASADAMRAQADAVLDGTHAVPGIPETWAYALLSVAGFLDTEVNAFNARTRPYAVSTARSFIYGDQEVLP